MSNYKSEITGVIITLIILLIFFSFKIIQSTNKQTITVTINEKVVKNSKNESRYLLFTDKEVLENRDMWLRGKFNSSDLQSELKVGHTYEMEVVGYRVRMLSWYRNILSAKEVNK